MNHSQFSVLPGTERLSDLNEQIFSVTRRNGGIPENMPEEELEKYLGLEQQSRQENESMLLASRSVQEHEKKVEQFLSILNRFAAAGQGGLREIKIDQRGIPNEYLKRIQERASLQFPGLKLNVRTRKYYLSRRIREDV